MKVEITVDEKWPIFSITNPQIQGETFHYDLPEEMLKDYFYVMRKYYEFQLQLQSLYEQSLRKFNEKQCLSFGRQSSEDGRLSEREPSPHIT